MEILTMMEAQKGEIPLTEESTDQSVKRNSPRRQFSHYLQAENQMCF